MSVYPVRFSFDTIPAAQLFGEYMDSEDPLLNGKMCLLYLYDVFDYDGLIDHNSSEDTRLHITNLQSQVEHWMKEAGSFGSLQWAYASGWPTARFADLPFDVSVYHGFLEEAIQTQNWPGVANVLSDGVSAWQVMLQKELVQKPADIEKLSKTFKTGQRVAKRDKLKSWLAKSVNPDPRKRTDVTSASERNRLLSMWNSEHLPETLLDAMLARNFRVRYDGHSYYRFVSAEMAPKAWKGYVSQ